MPRARGRGGAIGKFNNIVYFRKYGELTSNFTKNFLSQAFSVTALFIPLIPLFSVPQNFSKNPSVTGVRLTKFF